MRVAARNIWEIKVQTICSVVSAGTPTEVELWMCGNFGQASLDPPRIVINPNRLYPLEQVVRDTRRFSVNVLSVRQQAIAENLMRLRRRDPRKVSRLGQTVAFDTEHATPFLPGCLRTLFCQVEDVLDTGDHSLVVALIAEVRCDSPRTEEFPLLFPTVSSATIERSLFSRIVRSSLSKSRIAAWAARAGVKDLVRGVARASRSETKVDLAANTYAEGGYNESELQRILRHGARDEGRKISLTPPPSSPQHRRVGVCVVGTGAWGSFYAGLIRKAHRNAELYICGRDLARAERVARATGAVDTVQGLDQAVADSRFDALVLALPHDAHAEASIKAAEAGKHVLVEKPIATEVLDAQAMIESARRAGTILMVAENFQFRPAVLAAAEMIQRGDIGEPLYFSANAGGRVQLGGWKGDKARMGGGVLMDIGIHYIRALRILMGEPRYVTATKAMQVNTKISGEDTVQVLFSSPLGWEAQMLLNWVSPRGAGPDVVIAGERGTLHLWPGDAHVDLYHGQNSEVVRLASRVSARLGGKLARLSKGRKRMRLTDRDPGGYLGEIREFLAAVSERRAPACGPEHGARDLEIVVNAYDGLERREWVSIPSFDSRQSPV